MVVMTVEAVAEVGWVQELVVVGVVAVVVGMPAVVEVVAGGSGSPRVVGDRSRSGNGENGREWWW